MREASKRRCCGERSCCTWITTASQYPNRDVEMQQSSNNVKKVTCDRNKRLNCRRKVAGEVEEEDDEEEEDEVLDKRVEGVEGTLHFRLLRRLLP